jgi:hypothetical protein
MKTITLRDIQQTYNKKKQAKEESFEKVLEQCYRKISRIVQQKYELFVFYEVPECVLGYPLYNVDECLSYAKTHLEQNGFLVKYFFPNILYISWNQAEIEKAKLQTEMQTISHFNKLLTSDVPEQKKTRQPKSVTHAKLPAKKRLTLNL